MLCAVPFSIERKILKISDLCLLAYFKGSTDDPQARLYEQFKVICVDAIYSKSPHASLFI